MSKRKLTTGEVLAELRVTQKTLEAWIRRGILHPQADELSGWRVFDGAEICALRKKLPSDRGSGLTLIR